MQTGLDKKIYLAISQQAGENREGSGAEAMMFSVFAFIVCLPCFAQQTDSSLPSKISQTTTDNPGAVVGKFYEKIVELHPVSIPDGKKKEAIWPFLSKRLIQQFELTKACEKDYDRQTAGSTDKPPFAWLESGLFSGENELAVPDAADVKRVELRKRGLFHVYVRLTYRNALHGGRPDDPTRYRWDVAAIVIREGGRFVVDDILEFKDESRVIASRLSHTLTLGCKGPVWVGEKEKE